MFFVYNQYDHIMIIYLKIDKKIFSISNHKKKKIKNKNTTLNNVKNILRNLCKFEKLNCSYL